MKHPLSSCIIVFMEYRKQAHIVYYTQYYIVVSTKYHRKVLKADTDDYLQRKLKQINSFHAEIEILKLRGHYNYYGVSGNSHMISKFRYVTIRLLKRWLNHHSLRKSFNWEQLNEYLGHYPLLRPKIVHNFYKPLPSREIV